jgi:uncharacterized protein
VSRIVSQLQSRDCAMRRFLFLVFALTLLICAMTAPALAGQEIFLGIWYGELVIPNGPTLRLALEVGEHSDGSLMADLVSIDQGADGAPSSSVSFADRVLRVEIGRPSVVIEGEISEDGQTLEGEYRQGTFSAPLSLQRIDRVPGFALRRQNPVRPYPYDEEVVAYPGGADEVTLVGTLTLPLQSGMHPAVVLVTGSGPQGRDELIGYHRPFLVLADYLTRRGIAVLRYDDRGVGESIGPYDSATTADFADDAMAGVTYLRSRLDIDPDRVGIVGHSEGGMIAPMVAAGSPEVDFIVLLAGPGIPIDELIVTQIGLFALEGGATEEEAEAQRGMHRVIHQTLNAEEDRAEIYTAIHAYYDGLSDAERALLGWSKSILNGVIESRLTPWWRYFLTFDPAVYLEQVDCPVLAVNGNRDLNVPAEENLAAIDRILGVAGNVDYHVAEFPGLNHMLNANGYGEPDDASTPIDTISPEVLDLVASWVREQVGLSVDTAVGAFSTGLPQQLELERNYPNPFNGSTTIRFHVPRNGTVELVVYNLAGQRVVTLVRGAQEEGVHSIQWDGTGDSGHAAASGMYVYQLRVGTQLIARRLLLVR